MPRSLPLRLSHFRKPVVILSILLAARSQTSAQGYVIQHAGAIKTVSAHEIVLQYNNEVHTFIIHSSTRICVNGSQVASWRDLAGEGTGTVITAVSSDTALEIHNRGLESSLGLYRLQPVPFECKSGSAQNGRVREIQELLSTLGYQVGRLDGVMGTRTRRAIQEFQRSHEQKVTGEVSETLLEQLTNAARKAKRPPPNR
jgi:hypothetical protein